MNKEIIKAMNKKETKIDTFKKWWRKNGYKVMRVVLFPIWWGIWAKKKIHAYRYKRLEWSEERANEILSYYIPRKCEWNAEDKTFYFADNGMDGGMKYHLKKIKMKDKAWWVKYSCGWDSKVGTHLIEKFELEGFIKEVSDTYYDCWTEVYFRMNEK